MNHLVRIASVFAFLAASSCGDGHNGALDGGVDGADHGDSGPTRDGSLDAPSIDGGPSDATNMYVPDGESGPSCDGSTAMACTPMPSGCEPTEICNDGLDNNCDLHVDEGCPCLPGTVQTCFAGPPGSRHVGACSDGTQRCEGGGEFGTWGACTGGISPGAETCDMLDNDCNGCADESLCCNDGLSCPGPGDPRVPTGRPFTPVMIDGTRIFTGAATSWSWTIQGGPCEALLPNPTFSVDSGMTSPQFQFTPTLSGDYTITMTVTLANGSTSSCTFVVHVAGEGLRVELCWRPTTPMTNIDDLDLYLHEPDTMGPWFSGTGAVTGSTTMNSCNWADCGPSLRGGLSRVDWGYAPGPLSECSGGPGGATFAMMGSCPNPRIDVDGHGFSSEPRHGFIENINADNPRDGQHFRIMVQDCVGPESNPLVNVYCGGFLRATIGAAPDLVTMPAASDCSGGGPIWRVADLTVHVNAAGVTTGCDVVPIRAAGGGADIRTGDVNY